MARVGIPLVAVGLFGGMLVLRLFAYGGHDGGIGGREQVRVIESTPCSFGVPNDSGIVCGNLLVPENRARSDSRTIRVAFAVFKARDRNPLPDPFIYIDGGPGGETLKNAQLAFSRAFEPIAGARRDVIMFDQRGVGASSPNLRCTETEGAVGFSTAADRLKACRNRLESAPADLSGYTSAEMAADVHDLVRALGYRSFNVAGTSFGTTVALRLLHDHPDGVRSVILDSTSPPDEAWVSQAPRSRERAIHAVAVACAADKECAKLAPDFENDYYKLAARLDVLKRSVQYQDSTGKNITVAASGSVLTQLVDLMLRTGGGGAVPFYVETALEGNYSAFDQGLKNLGAASSALNTVVSTTVYSAVVCNEEAPFETPAVAKDSLTGVREAFRYSSSVLDRCKAWTARPDPSWHRPVASSVPTLVLSGQFDPITPPAYAKQAATHLANSKLVVFPGLGHGLMASACPQALAKAFVEHPSRDVHVSCLDNLKAPAFRTK